MVSRSLVLNFSPKALGDSSEAETKHKYDSDGERKEAEKNILVRRLHHTVN